MMNEVNEAKIAVIGGSGLYDMEGLENIREVDVDTPFGRPSDKIILGEMEGLKVAFLPRHGRGHYYVPSGVNYRANIFALKKLGVQKIISASAVGSMKEEIVPGDIVVIDQLYDHTKHRESSFFGNGLVVHIGFSDPICPGLSMILADACRHEGVKIHEDGLYICMEGPQFSTKGESEIYRKWGVDVIGMTAMPEAKLAREAEMCYATMALVTDYDCWHPEHAAVTVDIVIKQLMENAENAKKILAVIFRKFASEGIFHCGCNEALKNSIMTAPDKMDPEMRKDLDILVGKYMTAE
jgi:5'-methylthioadenosine phosphorylase